MKRLDDTVPDGTLAHDERFLAAIDKRRKKPAFAYEVVQGSEYPEIIVKVPDSWPYVDLAPLYDVHFGNKAHDSELFQKHKEWVRRSPYALTWNGGDYVENASKLSVGAGVYEQDYMPQNQFVRAVCDFADLSAKMMFSISGNHEGRNSVMGVDISQWVAMMCRIPYFPDYVYLTIKFRGNNFRGKIHHGSGGAQTDGGQIMAAMKDTHGSVFDFYWTGHLHQGNAKPIFQLDFDQKTQRAFERTGFVVQSPSYLKYYRTYAATKRYKPGMRGMHVLRLNPDGRMDIELHARGKRL